MNFKDTLNILKTDFEMRANLPNNEPIVQKFWQDKSIYQKVLDKNINNKQWILHDGPPYANGNIHVGHALNKIIKDIIVRYYSLNNFYCKYIPGWDTHGLPIEHALLKKGINNKPGMSIVEKRNNCLNFALENVAKQKEQFIRLGTLSDFQEKYLTCDLDFEIRQLNLFLEAIKKNLIFQDFKPIYWSWSSRTALAEAEIEYQDLKAPSIYVAIDVKQSKTTKVSNNDKLVIWTTTPWTIPSNLAIAVHPDFKYVKVKVQDQYFIVSKNKVDDIAKTLVWKDPQIIDEFLGKELEYTTYYHPWFKEKEGLVILAEYVTDDNGTGLVHNAPGFGAEDYYACKKYNIGIYCPINEFGKFDSSINDKTLENVFYDDANRIITERLSNENKLLKLSFFLHSAPIDWRTKKPIIYRSTKQWFINIESIKDELNKSINQVVFPNEINKTHLLDMIKNRVEWCISRQRVWGVPIPIIFDENKKPILDQELIQNIINILKKEGINVWFEKPVEYFLTKKYLLSQSTKYYKETDTMDVWFDSGSSFTLLEAKGLNYPADLYFEGNDQYRGWFNSSLINSVIYSNKAPFKRLLSHGFVLDEKGFKMSKSLGNVVDPSDVCKKYGADILRLWAASSNFNEDVRISDNILKQVSETYRRIRNTLFKFILANISDFKLTNDYDLTQLNEADLYILNTLNKNIDKIYKCYENFDFLNVVKIINNHTVELSSWYFEIIKDDLYCDSIDAKNRRNIQFVLYKILSTYLMFLTPIIPHTCEEVYRHLNIDNKKESVMLESMPKKIDIKATIDQSYWDMFFKLKSVVYTELEKARNDKIIKKSNEASIDIYYSEKIPFNIFILKKYLNVAQIKLHQEQSELKAKVSNANLVRCERCWNYFENSEIVEGNICKRCHKVINKK